MTPPMSDPLPLSVEPLTPLTPDEIERLRRWVDDDGIALVHKNYAAKLLVRVAELESLLASALQNQSAPQKVYVIMAGWGTCPGDSYDDCHSVFASKAEADAFVAAHPDESGGPYYSVQEHEVAGSPLNKGN